MQIFYGLMIFSFLLMLLVVFPKIEKPWVRPTIAALFVISMLLGLVCCFRDPGYLKRDEEYDFLDLL
jgi:hypothetical protein